MFQSKVLVCKDCQQNFEFTSGEQEFYSEKGFKNDPVRCPDCRSAKKKRINNNGKKEGFNTTCADCGQTTQVPFKPSGERPVYCRECYNKKRIKK
jgi:CxxC-x17-CxxC domain-containing protein